jgi:hypothetical protein
MQVIDQIKKTESSALVAFASKTPDARVMVITPEAAEAMLQSSAGNRRYRQWYVDLLSASIKRGEWRVTSQGIGFDTFGRLRDGHHRLSGVLLAKTSIRSVVVFGLQTDAYEVIDIGMVRTYADRLNERRDVADVLRLGAEIATGGSRPSIDQMRPIIDSGLGRAATALVEFCGSKQKYFSSAAMKLAACVSIMNGGAPDFILNQYRAMCHSDFNSMSQASQALVRQVNSGKATATMKREAIARGLRVFDQDRQHVTKIQVSDADTNSAVEFVRTVLRSAAKDYVESTQLDLD